jgi:hypothetical protein
LFRAQQLIAVVKEQQTIDEHGIVRDVDDAGKSLANGVDIAIRAIPPQSVVADPPFSIELGPMLARLQRAGGIVEDDQVAAVVIPKTYAAIELHARRVVAIRYRQEFGRQ